jgi:hypothetical protein
MQYVTSKENYISTRDTILLCYTTQCPANNTPITSSTPYLYHLIQTSPARPEIYSPHSTQLPMSWTCCTCGTDNPGEPINDVSQCAHCSRYTCENCGYADYAVHYVPMPRIAAVIGGSGEGVRRCTGTVKEGMKHVGMQGVERRKEDSSCCVVM